MASSKPSAPARNPSMPPPPSSPSSAHQASAARSFCSLLAECGCTLCPEALVLPARDFPSFLQRLEHRLKSDSHLLQAFLLGLQDFVSSDSDFRRLLMPFSGSGPVGGLDTLLRALLSIPVIQTDVANVLLEKLPEYCADAGNDSSNVFPSLMESMPRLILSQFRWLDYLVDGENVAQKMMEVLSICPIGLQKDIIALIPEIISDSSHELVVRTLEQTLQGNAQLIAPVLDALSNLNLEDEHLDQVVSLAIASLRSADAEDIPLVVRFLLQSSTPGNVKRILYQLRENLHFVADSVVITQLKQEKLKGKAIMTNCEALVVEAIRSGLRFQNIMCEAILKEMKTYDKAHDYKVIDIWLLLIIYANGGPYKKVAESILKRKAAAGVLGKNLFNQCIKGRLSLLQDYFQPLLSVSHVLLASKELSARQLGSHSYVLIFEEFRDSYHRQEVLGSLVTHTGSGVDYEVSSALDALIIISSKHSEDLLQMSSYINSILDYLEGFQDSHLHQVYKMFGQLAIAAWSHRSLKNGSSTANELLIVLRKQIGNPDARYRRMGIIGAVRLISCLGPEYTANHSTTQSMQKSSFEEILSFLHMVMEVCKSSSTTRGFLYDELADLCETMSLDGNIMEWVSRQTIEFESLFVGDLDLQKSPSSICDIDSLEGEPWMNLDGEVSPILINILTLLTSDDVISSQALMFLPSSFRLLAAVERATNEGSLGNIDALLGCPFYLPKHQYFEGNQWKELPVKLKELGCLSLYYTINWIRELINAYSTQLDGRTGNLTQPTREEISMKLLKRVRNLMFLEHLLDECMKCVPSLCLPILHYETETGRKTVPRQSTVNVGKKVKKRKAVSGEETQNADATPLEKGISQAGTGKLKQIKLSESYGKKTKGIDTESQHSTPLSSSANHEKNEETGKLEEQRGKFRPLRISSISILSIPQEKSQTTCCPDPHAELPLHLYVLNDLEYKLECLSSQNSKQCPWSTIPNSPKWPSGLGSLTSRQFLENLHPVFPSLRKHLDTAANLLSQDFSVMDKSCDEHWNLESSAAGNPAGSSCKSSKTNTASSLLLVTLRCLSKILANQEEISEHNFSTLRKLLSAFCALDSGDDFLLDLQPPPPKESMEYAFCSVYSYLDKLFDAAVSTSFSVTSELVVSQKALIACAGFCIDVSKATTQKNSGLFRTSSFFPYLKNRLSKSAGRVLQHEWDDDGQGKNIKNKVDKLQQLIRIFLQYSDSPLELLEDLASNIMPQVPVQKGRSRDSVDGYPTLSPGTFIIWYRVQHEELQVIFNEVVKRITSLQKLKTAKEDDVTLMILQARQCATTMVSLVNLTKVHYDKTAIHSVAVKFGGKFIDSFIKGIDFWKTQYERHRDSINALVKELQKATRTIQTLCSEAKGMKKTPVTSKIPGAKRSLERYVFCVKALLHSVSEGNSFWMGNLKHKNLKGEEIGSQLPNSDEEVEEDSVPDNEEDGEQVELAGSEPDSDASDAL